jgi:site-specific DNA-methyltransferase (adenine-specific)
MPCAARDSHPAPFPSELPRRAILLSTWPGDLVCDPFSGSGSTLRVARDLGRHAIGVDLSETYANLSQGVVAQGVLL